MLHWMRQTILSLTILSAMLPFEAFACAKQGFCDLTDESISWNEGIPLAGEWQFYWKQLLTPEDIANNQGQLTGYLPLEEDWLDAKIPGVELHSESYATYHLSFRSSRTEPMTIRFPRLPAAAIIWVNGQQIAKIGRISTQGREKVGRQRLVFHSFVPSVGLNTITIEVSNFTYHFHGAHGGVAIGKPETILGEYQRTILRDSVTFGAILIMAFYHFYLWWIRRSRLSPLYFGLFCLSIGLRSLVAGQGQILAFAFPEAPVELQLKIEYLGIALPFFALILLVHDLYPREFPKFLAYPWAALAGFWALLIVFSTANIYPQALRTYQLFILAAGSMEIIALILAAIRGREGARTFLAGFGIFFATSVTDILMAMNILQTPPIAHIGTFTLVFFQAILLSRRFDRAFDHAERAEKEVRSLNEGLEQKVKERTDQINTILRNVSSGFLLIDRQGHLQPGFTDSCHSLIGLNLVPGMVLADFLPIDAKTKVMLRETIIQVFEDFMPTEVSLSQIPQPLAIGDRMLGVSGAALRDEAGVLWAILFTLTDVTRLQEAEKAIRYNEMLIGIIREKAAFKVFLEDFRKEIQLSFAALQSHNEKAVRNLLHTMKGNLGAFGMRPLAEFIHSVEGQETITQENISELSLMMEHLLKDNNSLIGLDRTNSTFEVLRSDYNAIIAWSARNLERRQHQELLKMLKSSCQSPIRSFIGPLQNTAERLAERLEKEISCEITGDDIHVDERFSSVLRNLIHLVRNAVDHGIELPEHRGQKNRQGSIKVAFAQNARQLEILVQDDGRGLNPEVIKKKARSAGLLTGDEQALSDEDIYKFIFAQGFSTADEVSDISGRGVGMSAILESVEELSGKLRISSTIGQGMKVRIEVPLPEDDFTLLNLDFAI